jgi:hypothetical protein
MYHESTPTEVGFLSTAWPCNCVIRLLASGPVGARRSYVVDVIKDIRERSRCDSNSKASVKLSPVTKMLA